MKSWRRAIFVHTVTQRHRRISKPPRLIVEHIEDEELCNDDSIGAATRARILWLLQDALKRMALGRASCLCSASVISRLLATGGRP